MRAYIATSPNFSRTSAIIGRVPACTQWQCGEFSMLTHSEMSLQDVRTFIWRCISRARILVNSEIPLHNIQSRSFGEVSLKLTFSLIQRHFSRTGILTHLEMPPQIAYANPAHNHNVAVLIFLSNSPVVSVWLNFPFLRHSAASTAIFPPQKLSKVQLHYFSQGDYSDVDFRTLFKLVWHVSHMMMRQCHTKLKQADVIFSR